jgi:hypothetical protein
MALNPKLAVPERLMLEEQVIQDDMTDLWYEKATVRYTPRILVPSFSGDELVYPAARSMICDHPLVQARGGAVRSYIITQAAYLFLYNVTLMETKFVIQSSLDILHQDTAGISDFDKLRALTIVIDEGYHAHVALDYILQMKEQSGIEPLRIPQSNRKLDAIARASADLPEELRADFQLLAVTLAENVITEEVANMGREKDLVKSFANLMMDHVRDEGRHSNYFSDLMKRRWPALEKTTQERLATILPAFLDDYLDVDRTRQFERQVLRACDFSADEAARIISDSNNAFITDHERATKKTKARLFRLIQQIGILDLEANRQAFAHHDRVT